MMVTNPYRMNRGMGAPTPGQDAQLVGSMTASIAPLTGPAAPIVAAVGGIIAAAGAIVNALGIGTGCGANCIAATKVVNQAEPVLQQNLAAYENGQIDQATAQSNYQQTWTAIQQACGGIPGAAGSDCVSDRAQGSCKWKQTANPQYPGQPALGACWNWYEAYYVPLTSPSLNPISSVSSVSSLLGGMNLSSPAVIGGVLVLMGLMMGGKD